MQVLNIFHVLIAIALIAFVLVQRGQGATAGAAFGSGASGTVFGARGAGNFLSRSTWVLAGLFCAISLAMAVMVSRMMAETPEADLGVVAALEQTAAETQPQPPQELSLESDEPPLTDVPAFEPAAENLAPVGEGSVSEDLPAIEGSEDAAPPASDDS